MHTVTKSMKSVLAVCFVLCCPHAMAAGPDVLRPSDCEPNLSPTVLIIYDLEGISEVRSSRAILAGSIDFENTKRAATSDVNAVIAGLFHGGAASVDVADGHGSGAYEPDILVADLDPRATLILRDRPFFPSIDLSASKAYDAVVLVGYKSRTRGGGFAAHTRTFGLEFLVDNRPVNEVELIAMAFGEVETPVIMVSGDDALARELLIYPWIQYAEVKTVIDTRRASPVKAELAKQRLKKAAVDALQQWCEAGILKLAPATSVGLRALPPASFAGLQNIPGIEMENSNTFTFIAENGFADAQKGWAALASIALGGWFSAARRELSRAESNERVNENILFLALIAAWEKAEMGEDKPLSHPGNPLHYNGVP